MTLLEQNTWSVVPMFGDHNLPKIYTQNELAREMVNEAGLWQWATRPYDATWLNRGQASSPSSILRTYMDS